MKIFIWDKELPDSINQFKRLTELNLYNNKLTKIPQTINAISTLRYLNVRYIIV